MSMNLAHNFIIELKKKDIDVYERATIIKQYIEDRGIPTIELCRELNIPKSTMSGWLKPAEFKPGEFQKLKQKGLTNTEIINSLRYHYKEKKQALQQKRIDYDLEKVITRLKSHVSYPLCSKFTKPLIKECHDLLNRIEMRWELKNKR